MLKSIAVITAVLFASLQASAVQARDIQTAVVAGGCFWCVEADFEKVNGVLSAVSGYAGGSKATAKYKKVTAGGTGHYEAVQIKFDADVISYRKLMDIFWRTVDPTDAGGQFCDRGKSYRTAVFASKSQQADAKASKSAAQSALGRKIVTPILAAAKFYKAEAYHQDYYKGTNRVLTRFGYVKQIDAYKKYRKGCGRDKRVRALWGSAAPFAG